MKRLMSALMLAVMVFISADACAQVQRVYTYDFGDFTIEVSEDDYAAANFKKRKRNIHLYADGRSNSGN